MDAPSGSDTILLRSKVCTSEANDAEKCALSRVTRTGKKMFRDDDWSSETPGKDSRSIFVVNHQRGSASSTASQYDPSIDTRMERVSKLGVDLTEFMRVWLSEAPSESGQRCASTRSGVSKSRHSPLPPQRGTPLSTHPFTSTITLLAGINLTTHASTRNINLAASTTNLSVGTQNLSPRPSNFSSS